MRTLQSEGACKGKDLKESALMVDMKKQEYGSGMHLLHVTVKSSSNSYIVLARMTIYSSMGYIHLYLNTK